MADKSAILHPIQSRNNRCSDVIARHNISENFVDSFKNATSIVKKLIYQGRQAAKFVFRQIKSHISREEKVVAKIRLHVTCSLSLDLCTCEVSYKNIERFLNYRRKTKKYKMAAVAAILSSISTKNERNLDEHNCSKFRKFGDD